jgi:hypothetical protein
MSDYEISDTPSSPLSTALDTTALEASSRATDGTAGDAAGFISESSDTLYVKSGGKVYLRVDHTANQRKGTNPSWIWNHGEELRYLVGSKAHKNWRCTYCIPPKMTIIPVENTTFHAGEHLRKKHNLYKPGSEPKPRRSIGQVAGAAYQSLISTIQADRFRYLLIRWIVCMHIALSVVEHSTFRDLILYISPALESLLVRSGKSIRRWILTEFDTQKRVVHDYLA